MESNGALTIVACRWMQYKSQERAHTASRALPHSPTLFSFRKAIPVGRRIPRHAPTSQCLAKLRGFTSSPGPTHRDRHCWKRGGAALQRYLALPAEILQWWGRWRSRRVAEDYAQPPEEYKIWT